jgi:hypothetical protein
MHFQEIAMINVRILAVVLFALMGSVVAREIVMPVAMNKADFEASKARLVGQLDSDRYSEITPQDKHTVLTTLERMDARLSKVASADQMSEQDRVDMFNDQEIINTITTHAAIDSRLICIREAPTGSHRIRVTCQTLAVLKARESVGQDAMYRIKHNENSTCSYCE